MKFDRLYFLDGALGTYLQKLGNNSFELPEIANLKSPNVIIDIHEQYLEAGADIITANTFGANRFKLSVPEVIKAAVKNAKTAISNSGYSGKYIALDVGPTGKLLRPFGDLDFDTCVDVFKEMVTIGEAEGADIILIETMIDISESRAAIIAAKENTKLPVFCTMTLDKNGRTITGADVTTIVTALECLGIDAIGLNCTLEPSQMLPIVKALVKSTSLPVIFQPNAGIPTIKDNVAVYDVDENIFADSMLQIALAGANILGGCCGTEPKHIAKLISECRDIKPKYTGIKKANKQYISSYSKAIAADDNMHIGNRLNCKLNIEFAKEIQNKSICMVAEYVLEEMDDGCDIINITLNSDESTEMQMFPEILNTVQSVSNIPVIITTQYTSVLDTALKHYSGRAAVQIDDPERFKLITEKYKPFII